MSNFKIKVVVNYIVAMRKLYYLNKKIKLAVVKQFGFLKHTVVIFYTRQLWIFI